MALARSDIAPSRQSVGLSSPTAPHSHVRKTIGCLCLARALLNSPGSRTPACHSFRSRAQGLLCDLHPRGVPSDNGRMRCQLSHRSGQPADGRNRIGPCLSDSRLHVTEGGHCPSVCRHATSLVDSVAAKPSMVSIRYSLAESFVASASIAWSLWQFCGDGKPM